MAARPAYISLCAGGGGLDLGVGLALPGTKCVCYVENEVTEAAVLAKGIESGLLDDAPVWSDLYTFDAVAWRGLVDGVVSGFPCQPHSFAGRRLGERDERNLWPAVARVVSDLAPRWCFFENVAGILGFYWREIRPVLCGMGFEVAEGIFSAEEVSAPHLRERLFWLAYRLDSTRRSQQWLQEPATLQPDSDRPELAHAGHGTGSAEHEQQQALRPAEPRLSGVSVADALSSRHAGRAPVAGSRRAGRVAAARAGEGVGDTKSESRQLHTRWRTEGDGAAFPPGPGDADGWRDWLREHPGTEPARPKSDFRDGADGLARSDWLRVLGNAVVPVAAAHALRTLCARMGVTL